MVAEIRLPPLGQTSDEMSIVEWYKAVGDSISIAEPLLCVETDKANVDVESAEEGVLLQIFAEPGELLPSGSLLAYVGVAGESLPTGDADEGGAGAESDLPAEAAAPVADPVAEAPAPAAESAVPQPEPVSPEPVAAVPATETPEPPASVAVPSEPTTPGGAPAAAPPPTARASGRPQAAPIVRKLASDLGVELSALVGTGRGGLITREDVQAAAAAAGAPASAAGAAAPASAASIPVAPRSAPSTPRAVPLPSRPDEIDVNPHRQAIARRLVRSTQTIPTFRLTADLDARAARRRLGAYGKGLTYTHLLLRAVAGALREHPAMLRLWIDDGPKYRVLTEPNVGLAVAGDDSLFVVTVPAPDAAELPALVEGVKAAADRGRRGVLSAQDRQPASITISNLGMFGVTSFDAIIDPEQNAILAAGAVRDAVVAVDGMFTVRPLLTVTLSCDHRAVDGAQAAQFLRTFRTLFETGSDGEDRS